MVVAGGLCIALSFAFGIEAFRVMFTALMIGGGSAFALMVPVLAGYIAFSIADCPGLTPGLIGGMLGGTVLASFAVLLRASCWLHCEVNQYATETATEYGSAETNPHHPLISSLVVGLAMIYLIGKPVAGILEGLTHWLQTMGTANAVLLGAILGGMMCTTLGGPVNKAAYAFGVGLLSVKLMARWRRLWRQGTVPPLAMGLATMVASDGNRQSAAGRWQSRSGTGPCFISEAEFRLLLVIRCVLPCCIVGGALTVQSQWRLVRN
ncbi:fructose-specific PTS transporter subunit EIIC [Escherichia coli]